MTEKIARYSVSVQLPELDGFARDQILIDIASALFAGLRLAWKNDELRNR